MSLQHSCKHRQLDCALELSNLQDEKSTAKTA